MRVSMFALALCSLLIIITPCISSKVQQVRRISSRHIAAAMVVANLASSTNCFATASIVEPPLPPLTTRQTVVRATNNALASNKILETIRKMDQFDDDDQVTSKTNTVFLLLPIVELEGEFDSMKDLFDKSKEDTTIPTIKSILLQEKYSTVNLKKMFNRYSDNIYYTDPNRANIYLAGGALPDSMQTQRYLLRNDVITFMGNVREDFEQLTEKNPTQLEE